jgi:hypothetical protein
LLIIAQQDATYEQKVEGGCWADGDIRFAEMHVQMSKEAFWVGMSKLRDLSNEFQGSGISQLRQSQNLANFRYLAKKLVTISHPMCAIATGGRDDKIMPSARKQIDNFRRSLKSPFVQQYDIAEADVMYQQSIIAVECADPSQASTDKLILQTLNDVGNQIAAIRTTMN